MSKLAHASPHLAPYRALLTPGGMRQMLATALDGQTLDLGRSLRVGEVSVLTPELSAAAARALGRTLFSWIVAELSIVAEDGRAIISSQLEFRLPHMTEYGTFVLGGLDYSPIVQLVPRPGLVLRTTITPSGLTRVVHADIVPEHGSWVRVVARQELAGRYHETSAGHGALGDDLQVHVGCVEIVEGTDGRRTDNTQLMSARGTRRRTRRLTIASLLEPGADWPTALSTCRLGLEGRERFNQVVESFRGTAQPGTGDLLTHDDILCVDACVRALAVKGDAEVRPAVPHEVSDLAGLRALTIADQLCARVTAASSIALRCAREELALRAGLNSGLGLRSDQEILSLFARFCQAAVELRSSPSAPLGVVRVPGTRRTVRSTFADPRLVQLLDETNPLASLSHRRKVTRRGPGGINTAYGAHAERDLHDSHRGRLCPFETPESEHIGFNLHLARGGNVEGGTLTTHGTGSDAAWLGWSASLVPFLPHNDAARILMAAKNMKQAVPLCEPEVPLIKTGAEREVAEAAGAVVRASVGGTVIDIKEVPAQRRWRLTIETIDEFGRRHNHDHHIPMSRPTATGTRAGFDRVLVQMGQSVRAGELLAEHPAVVGDELALGRNLCVAYMPFRGLNFEEGIVLSETAAKKLTSRHLVRVVIKLRADEMLWPGRCEPGSHESRPGRLDRLGVVREGERVRVGDEFVRSYALTRLHRYGAPNSSKVLRWQGALREYEQRTYHARPGHSGIVYRVTIQGQNSLGAKVEVWLAADRPLRVGDKLMGRHGNKGIVTAVLPDEDMPFIPDVGPVDAVLSPVGALTRMNLGQLIETHLGWVARHGDESTRATLPAAWPALSRVDGTQLKAWLRGAAPVDETGKVRVRLGRTGALTKRPVVVGYQYFLKLNHLAEEKITFRTVGRTGDVHGYGRASFQPPRGRRQHGGQRLGEMEVWALQAWNVPDLLAESVGAKSDDLTIRAALHDIVESGLIARGEGLRTNLTESWRAYLTLLLGLGIRAQVFASDSSGSERQIDWVSGAGGVAADRLLRVDLSLLNDADMEQIVLAQEAQPVTVMRAGAEPALQLRSWVVSSPESMEDRTWVRLSCGCEGPEELVLSRSSEATGRQQRCKKHRTQVSVASEVVEPHPVSGGLLDSTIWGSPRELREPDRCLGVIDLGVSLEHPVTGERVRYFPVLPPHLRTETIEHHYRQLLRWLRVRQSQLKEGAAKQEQDAAVDAVVAAFNRLVLDGFVGALGGKSGLLRQRLLGKRVDLSGRAVIVPDPQLPLDDCGVPLAAGLDLAEGSVRAHLVSALNSAVQPPSAVARALVAKMAEIDNEGDVIQWLVDHGIGPRQLARRLGVVGTLRGVLLSLFESPVLSGSGRSLNPSHRRRKSDRRHGIADLEKAIDGARATARQLADDLIRAAREGVRDLRDWARSRGVDAVKFGELAGQGSGESIGAWLARVCQHHLDENGVVVLLNRAPSLHRYSMHAFRPRVRVDDAISLHPALCGRFNADFDGDTMALHVPVQRAACARAFEMMRPSANLRSSAAGQPLVHFEQDAVAGMGFLALTDTTRFEREFGVSYDGLRKLGPRLREWAVQDPERVTQAMATAFDVAMRAGLSVGWFDIPHWSTTSADSDILVLIEAWLDEQLASSKGTPPALPLMVRAGALRDPGRGLGLLIQLGFRRGSFKTLSGGETTAVNGCLKLGLNDAELFHTAYGARKSLADKKLITPVAGGLTRELVWAAEGMRIKGDDCGAEVGIEIRTLCRERQGNTETLLSTGAWARGRFSVDTGEIVEPETAGERFSVRSPLFCKTRREGFICRRCYGLELSRGALPDDGCPIGTIAATSVGERGTQLAMRTFHSGGRSGFDDLTDGLPRICAMFAGRAVPVRLRNGVNGVDDWSIVEEGGCVSGSATGVVARRLCEISDTNRLARVFLFEMYQNYKVAEISPCHFEVLLASMLNESGVLQGARTATRRRASSLEAMAFGDVNGVVRHLVSQLRAAPSVTIHLGSPTFSRMLGRRR